MADAKPKPVEQASDTPDASGVISAPEGNGDDLLARAQVRAPSLTAEFVKTYGLSDDVLEKLARGELSPPPTVGPEHTVDLYYVNGGWQITPVGVKPEDVGKDAVSRP